MPRGIALYGHKTNGTARLVESRHKPATAAERIPNGITTTGGGRPETLPLRPATGRRLVAAGARVHSDALSRRARDAYPFPRPGPYTTSAAPKSISKLIYRQVERPI